MLMSCSIAVAWDNGQSVQVKLYSSSSASYSEQNPDENKNNHHRMPPRPILCSLSIEDGVTFCDGSNPDIISYEIQDADGKPVAVFSDGADFVQTLFSLTGQFKVRFHSDEYVYYGYVSFKGL